jgi:mRNA interferase RelE/StbE
MSYAVTYDSRGERDFERLPLAMMARIATELRGLVENPRPPGVTALKGRLRGMLRLRVGDWRIVYQVDDHTETVVITEIAHRGKVHDRAGRRGE